MNAVQREALDDGIVRKFLLAYELLTECARTNHPTIRRSSRKARVTLGPVVFTLGAARKSTRNEQQFHGLFMDG